MLSAQQMREVDRLTTERYGVPSLQLMENAASGTLEAIERKYGAPAGKRVLIVSGKGNNGGDGAALARMLGGKGASVDLVVLGRIEDTTGDARANFERAVSAGDALKVVEIESAEDLARTVSPAQYDLLVDAIFGTGLTRPAAGLYRAAIDLLNEKGAAAPVAAVDIPSGVSSDSPELLGPAVQANLTVTFTAPKIGNILPPACEQNGELVVVKIGSPDELVEQSGSTLNLVERPMIELWLTGSRRSAHANKGDAGKVLILAGSRGKTGAACLAGEAAIRAGAGLVTVATPHSSQLVVASRISSECMTEAVAETESGTASDVDLERVLELTAERDVFAMGPGLGRHKSTSALVRHLTLRCAGPVIIDADGLNSLAPWTGELRGRPERPLILTPHPGEMARLVDKSTSEVIRDLIAVALEFATTYSVVLVLKSSRTLVAGPDGEVWINPTGNAGMATGGSGDVLTGLLAGLLAQKPDDPVAAAVTAVYLHGLAGDIAASRLGTRAMIASDITAMLGDAFIEVGGDEERLVR